MIGFAGLSHLGIVSSLAAASRGESVVAFRSTNPASRNSMPLTVRASPGPPIRPT
jgi:hypothetical protein